MSEDAPQDAPLSNPTMATRSPIPELDIPALQVAERMARHKHAYGRSSPLLGRTPNPIVSAVNTATPSGFCAAPPDGSWCAVCVNAKVDALEADTRSGDRCAKVSLHWSDSSVDFSITRTNTIEVVPLVGDRITGAASNDGTLLLCCGSSGRVSLFSMGNQGDCVALDVPTGPWNCDVGGCAILSTNTNTAIRNFLIVCDASGRFFIGANFQQDLDSSEQPVRLAWRWVTCSSRSKLSLVHFLSPMNDRSFIIGGLGHMNLSGALEFYDLLDETTIPPNSQTACPVKVIRKHASLKNQLPHSMCVSASSGPRGILVVFNDGSVVMLSHSSPHSIDKTWSHAALLIHGNDNPVSEIPLFAEWMQRVVRVGWWSENTMAVIRRNGCCSINSTSTNSRVIRLLGPLEGYSSTTVASEVDVVKFLEGMPSAVCFSHSTLKGSVWSVSAPIWPSACADVIYLKASDIHSLFSNLIKRSCNAAVHPSDVVSQPFSGAREFYLKFHTSCVPNLSLDSLLVAEFVASKEPLEKRVALLPQMSAATVIELAVRQLVCSLPELIFHLETTILDIDIVRDDDDVYSEMTNTLFWARIFSVSGREGLDFKELMEQSIVPVWRHLKVLDESTFPRSYRDFVCKRIVCNEVADVALALMICDVPLSFDKHALVDDIVFYFWNCCASSYPEICNYLCVFEETSVLKNLLPSVGGCPLRIHENRARGAVDSAAANAAGKWSAIGFVDEAAVLSWYRKRVTQIETETGNISNIRDLLEVAVSQCNVKELASDLDDACDLCGLLYSAPILNISSDDANLGTFKLYSPEQRLWRVLSSFPLEDVPLSIVGVGRELVDRHNMPYSAFLDCVQHWAFDRGSAPGLSSPRRNASPLSDIGEYKYDILFAASALETLNDPSIDVLSWDESGEILADLVFRVCMRCSCDDEELDAVDRLLTLYKKLSSFSSTESRQQALSKLAEIDVIRCAADVCRVRGVEPIESIGEFWDFKTLRAKRGDSTAYEFMCGKIVDKAVCSDDSENSDPDFLRRDLTTLAAFIFGPEFADEAIGPVFLGALLRLRQWGKALECTKSWIFQSSKDLIFKSFHVCISNAILYFEHPEMTPVACVHDADLCLQLAKDLIASPVCHSTSDETKQIAEFNEIIRRQETLHRIASLMEDCGLESVQLSQISLAYFGNARQRRDVVDAIISEAPAIAPSQVMQLLEWFLLRENKKDAVDVLSNATVQAFDAGRINDAFELAKELCIFGQGESLPWAMLCKLARQAQSDDSDVQQNIVSTAVLHAPASEILDERNDRHWHAALSNEGSTLLGVGADLVMRLICEGLSDINGAEQWRRVKSLIVGSLCGVDAVSIKNISQCLFDVRNNKCVSIDPATYDRALEFVSNLENLVSSVSSLGNPATLQMLCGSNDDDVVSIVDDIIGQDEHISSALLKSILDVVERPEIARTRSESYVLNVYKLGLSPLLMEQAVCSLSQFLPPWSWRQTLAEVALRDQVSSSVTKGMLKSIVFVRSMSKVNSVSIGHIDYSLPRHFDEAFDNRVQVLASVGGANAATVAKHMQTLLENGIDLSLSEIMSICWQGDYQSCLCQAMDTVHMVISPSVEEGHVFACVTVLLSVIELLGLLPFCSALPQLLWQATCLVCAQDRLYSDALSAIDHAGDCGLRLVLSSQSQDNFGVSTSSLMSLFCNMRSNAVAASLKPHDGSSVLKSACCAAASLLTPSNGLTYRTLLVKFGDDPVVCPFIIFALGGEFESSRSTQQDDSSSLLQRGIECAMHELPDRNHRAPLDDVQRAVVAAVCDALGHTASPALLSDVSVTVGSCLERVCDIAREQLAPALSKVSRLLSSTSTDLSHAFKSLVRLLCVEFDEKDSIHDPAPALMKLLPSCGSPQLMAAALNVLHAIQGRPAFDASSCDDDFSVVGDRSVLDIPGNKEHGSCWQKVLCHCLQSEQCADLALHAYATSGRVALSADDEDAVYTAAPPSHAPTFRCLSLRPEVRASAFASMHVTPFALAALALSSLARDFHMPDSLPSSALIVDSLKSTDGCTIAVHACAATYAVPLSRSEIARLVSCVLLKRHGLRCAALVLAECDCVPVSRALAIGRGGLSILRKSIKEGIENGMLMIIRSHYRQIKDQISRDS